MNSAFAWKFGGPLGALPAGVAWGILGTLGVLGAIWILVSYRRTLRPISGIQRLLLFAIRFGVLALVLLCLANPSRVEQPPKDKDNPVDVAVLVDRSESMAALDPRGKSRLESAMQTWGQHEKAASDVYGKLKYYFFSERLDASSDLATASTKGPPGPETHLFAALRESIAAGARAVVCLTDGLDTSGESSDALMAEAHASGVPLYFVAGNNRVRPIESVNIRELKSPGQVLRRSKFESAAVFEISTPDEQKIPAEVYVDGAQVARTMIDVRPGLNVVPWAVPIASGEKGVRRIEFRIGSGEKQQVASATIAVKDAFERNVLYYQGSLQWGYRFLLGSLQSDPSFRVTGILTPKMPTQLTSALPGLALLDDLPSDPAALEPYQIIILSHVYPDQLTPLQQRALAAYAKAGGGVVFVAPDTETSEGFAGTAIEEMVPVVFERGDTEAPGSREALAFQTRMREAGGANPMQESIFAETVIERQDIPKLVPFAVPGGGMKSKTAAIFLPDAKEDVPRFSSYAKVLRQKPAAEVLAVHPTDVVPGTNAKRILLARQPYGKGFTAVLTTDLLWRWRMSLPSANRAPDRFWQQLLLSMAPAEGRGLRIARLSDGVAGQPVRLRVEGCEQPPKALATGPKGDAAAAVTFTKSTEEPGVWLGQFTPDAEGRWAAAATDPDGGASATITLPVRGAGQKLEASNLPPDLDGMRRLAEASGGALLGREPVFRKTSVELPALPPTITPLWNSGILLLVLLGFYATELCLRRWMKLL